MINTHLHTNYSPDSLFSSWTPSFGFAVAYAQQLVDEKHIDVHIAVVKREEQNGKTLPAWQVPLLGEAWGKKWDYMSHEFLVFGIVQAPQMKAISIDTLHTAGLLGFAVQPNKNYWGRRRTEPAPSLKMKPSHLRRIKETALTYGKDFGAVIVLALICRSRKHYSLGSSDGVDYTDTAISLIVEVLNEEPALKLPSPTLPGTGVQFDPAMAITHAFPDYKQFLELLPRVTGAQWGRGKRSNLKRKLEDKDNGRNELVKRVR